MTYTDSSTQAILIRERSRSLMLRGWILCGLFFMALPGTLLGFSNLMAISAHQGMANLPPAWMEGHGHAQMFGWIGSFILGIGFYSQPARDRRALKVQAICFGLWTSGVTLRWASNIYAWHWRVLLPASASFELIAVLLFLSAASRHKLPQPGTVTKSKPTMEPWMLSVMIGTVGLTVGILFNFVECIKLAFNGALQSFPHALDQKYLVLIGWGFLVPIVWGFSARWLPAFLAIASPDAMKLRVALGLDLAGILCGVAGFSQVGTLFLAASAIAIFFALHLAQKPYGKAKVQGIHHSFPSFIRLAYVWLVAAGCMSVWAAYADKNGGIWGASRHALTVGFAATMVFAMAPRILPHFTGVQAIFSKRLMFLSLVLLDIGCLLRVCSEPLAYERILPFAWKVLPVSGMLELTAVLVFAANLSITLLFGKSVFATVMPAPGSSEEVLGSRHSGTLLDCLPSFAAQGPACPWARVHQRRRGQISVEKTITKISRPVTKVPAFQPTPTYLHECAGLNEQQMISEFQKRRSMNYKRYWWALALVIIGSFIVLGGEGRKMISEAPPLPDVYTTNGQLLFTGSSITDGQNVWQSIGGQEIGTVWGHGAYVAPDWTADWLHRESEILLNIWAVRLGAPNFAALNLDQQAALKARLIREIRTNTYDPNQHRIVIDADRAAAFQQLSAYYANVFANGRAEYAIPHGALTNVSKQRDLGAFFWWTAWAAGTNRPGSETTYTNNWPHEPLIANGPTPGTILWSVLSFVGLLAGIGGLVWWYASQEKIAVHGPYPETDPFLEHRATPSQRATIKFFVVAIILWGVQIMMGILTAHYGVEGHSFYGFPLDRYLPYAVTRTWHLQLAIFWIATSWLATGLYVGPAVSRHEPKYQRLGVNVLFGALVFVVGGSLAGEWLGIQQRLGNMWFWFGSQGYEYVDLGRFWQILLFIGLVLWLVLMVAALKPALVRKSEDRSLLILFLISSIAIPLFYAAGLMYGQRSNLVTAEYWRWWVVHLWVEGFFEVFATVVIGFLFTRLRLIEIRTATKAALFSTSIFLSGGIIGTFHHLYFAGATPAVIGLGAIFSAFEVVPLTLIGYEAWDNLRIAQPTKKSPWIANYRWPIYFFVAVAFWNLVGAGLFGFLINPPISLYYVQGLNLTPLHGHTALFGVYGMLGLGLTLFCLRALIPGRPWKDGPLKLSFWCLNIGLSFMALLSMLPIGLLQARASIQYGTWYARSAEFMQSSTMQTLRWMRVPGDILFSIGAALFAWFLLGLLTGHSYKRENLLDSNLDMRETTSETHTEFAGR